MSLRALLFVLLLQTLRAQNEALAQRLHAADSTNAALQAGLDKSWQSAHAADRAAQESKQQLMQAQQTILQLRQQLLQQGERPVGGARIFDRDSHGRFSVHSRIRRKSRAMTAASCGADR